MSISDVQFVGICCTDNRNHAHIHQLIWEHPVHASVCRTGRSVRESKKRSGQSWFFCFFVCINKTRKTILRLLCSEGIKPPGSDYTREEAQTTCIPKTAACFRVPMRTRTDGFAFKKKYLRLHSPREIALLLATNRGCAVKYVSQKWNESRWYNILVIFMLRFNCTSILD